MKRYLSIIFITFIFFSKISLAQVEGTRISEEEAEVQLKYLEADAAFFLGDYEVAIKKYKEIYALDRSNDAVAYNLSRTYLGLGDMESAEKYINKAMSLSPDNKWYKLMHANTMRDEERHEEALSSYSWLANKEPSNRFFVENHAFSLLKLDRPLEAIQVIESWESREGVSELFSKKKYEIYDALGENEKAATALKDLAETFPRNIRLWHNLATYYIKIDNKEEAKKVYNKIIEVDPRNADAKMKLATLSNQNSTSDQLNKIISDAGIGVDDKVIVLLPLLDQVISKRDSIQRKQLLQLATSLSKQYPNNAKVYALLGDAHFHSNDYPKAIEAYKNTLERNARVYPVWENYMHALFREGLFDSLSEVAYDAIDNFPNKVSAYYYYSIAQSYKKEFSEAESYLNEAYMIAGKNKNFHQLITLGQAYKSFSEGNLEKANTLISTITEDQLPYHGVELLGDIAFKMGDKKQAISFWKKAYQIMNEARIQSKIDRQSL